MAVRLGSLTLNSLYDEGAYRASQQRVYGASAPNPFEVGDPFTVSNSIPAAPPVQMATLPHHQNNPFAPFQPVYSQPQKQPHLMMSPQNPFGDAGFGAFLAAPTAAHPQTTNLFGSTALL